ncbi:MAG: PRC-barrel domain-containing protein, partial [Terracoccus sp.]
PSADAATGRATRVPSNPRFPEIEERVLRYWDADGTFVASVENRDAGTDGDAIGEAADAVARLAGKSNTMLKKQAVSSFGDHIGTVTDVAFDGDTGAIQSVLVDGEPVPADRLLGVGSYAVVLEAEPTP